MKFYYKLKKAPLLLTVLFSSTVGLAQNVGVNSSGSNPSTDAMLDVSSTTKGLLIPRVSIANLTTIAPITGGSTESLIVYNTNAGTGKGYYYWDGAKWNRLYDQTVNGADHDWYEVGGTTAPNSINDDQFTQGDVGIGVAVPSEQLHVAGGIRTDNSRINSGNDHLSLMQGVRADDNTYEWTGFYSGNTRQGIILYDGSWTGANSLTNEFGITAENGNKLTLNTTGNSDVALMPDGTGKVGILTTSPTEELTVNGWIGRTAHNNGALAGSYNSVGANSAQTNPIYIIGTGYKPNATTLNNMYGIGYSHTNASYITDPGPDTWGMYVAADGDARIWLGASAGGVSYFDAGNVGIGTTTPASKLHVTGSTRMTGDFYNQQVAFDSDNGFNPGSNNTWINTDLSVTVTTTGTGANGSDVFVACNGSISCYADSYGIRILRDGVFICGGYQDAYLIASATRQWVFSHQGVDSPPAGVHTYRVQVLVSDGSTNSDIIESYLSVLEIKK